MSPQAEQNVESKLRVQDIQELRYNLSAEYNTDTSCPTDERASHFNLTQSVFKELLGLIINIAYL